MATDNGDMRPHDAAASAEDNLEDETPDDYQPDIQLSEEQTQDPTFPRANPANAAYGDDGDDPGDDGGDYDPEAIGDLSDPSDPEPKPAKPQTTGGFIIDADSDEEEEDDEEEEADESQAPTASAAGSARGQVASAGFLDENDQTTSDSPTVQPSGTSAPVPQPSAEGQDVPDRITVLEGRVKDDPRGDMDAWLSLIDEHRRQNNLDQIRGVYNRFLDIFPHSVSLAPVLRVESGALRC
jgi:cleavage stimulation factor subunit 3